VIVRLGAKYWPYVIRCLTLGTLSVVSLAGCTSQGSADRPATDGAFTHAQVLSWVTPSLGNGISFVGSVPPTATTEQLVAASRPLNAAASVSMHELTLVPWTGVLHPREKELVKVLTQIKKLTTTSPVSSFRSQLDADIVVAQGALRALNLAVTG
jgi:hypothetical protein